MNTSKSKQSGNVLIYVLIAVVLLAALTFAMTRQDSGTSGSGGLTDDKADLKAGELIQYATAARSTVEQMQTMSNVLPTELSFAKQGDAAYTTGSNTPKVYHPGGGGLEVFVPEAELFSGGARGWTAQQGTNVTWTPSTASDVIFTFLDVNPKICAAINDRLYKDKTIPTITLAATAVFVNGGGDDVDFTTASCASCEGKPSYCVKDSAGAYAFYNVIVSR